MPNNQAWPSLAIMNLDRGLQRIAIPFNSQRQESRTSKASVGALPGNKNLRLPGKNCPGMLLGIRAQQVGWPGKAILPIMAERLDNPLPDRLLEMVGRLTAP